MTSRAFFDGRAIMHHGDSRDVLKTLADASIDSVVCDPPYALVSIGKRFGAEGAAPAKEQKGAAGAYARASAGFMGQAWDTGETAFAVEFWAEVFRVLKPGGHVVAFSGTRTYHRLACAIEDAGFEIRDQLAWVYSTGFPKSHDVSKGIDKRRVEDVGPIRAICRFIRAGMDAKRLKSRHLVEHFGGCNARLIDHWAARDTDSQPSLPTAAQWASLKEVLALDDSMDPEFARLDGRKGEAGDTWKEAEVVGEHESAPRMGFGDHRFSARDTAIREPSPEAAKWKGWKSALKPAWEPIVLARKPMIGTAVVNVLAFGTGALNIDGCRVNDDGTGYPANIIHDGSDEVVNAFPVTTVAGSTDKRAAKNIGILGAFAGDDDNRRSAATKTGSAARFFYSAKANKRDRAGSKHPTVKPVDCMRWLARLVTPPGGIVLEPFAGSGTTLQAAIEEGFRVVGVERDDTFFGDCCNRLDGIDGETKPRRAERKPPPALVEAVVALAAPEPVPIAPPPPVAILAPPKPRRVRGVSADIQPSFLTGFAA